MMRDVPDLHEQRARAESFGSVAAAYDRYRPGYPDELIDRLAALQPAAVLDIGCGTGKASRQLLARGLAVLGVEPDPQMAAIARSHGVEVELAAFEQWDARGRTFDLIVAGQSWHWVDPAVGAPKVVRLLRPGGTACFFWNLDDLEDPERQVAEEIYQRLAPSVLAQRSRDGDDSHTTRLERTGCFGSVRTERVPWRYAIPVDDWIGRVGTYSQQLLLGPQRLAELQRELRAALAQRGPEVRLIGDTYVVWARP
jgi:SAM-dependent methyltransferase